MNSIELYNHILNLFPTPQSYTGEYITELRLVLKSYQQLVSSSALFKNEVLDRLAGLCNALNDVILFTYKGMHSKAYIRLRNQLDGYVKNNKVIISPIVSEINLHSVGKDDTFYRMRYMSEIERSKAKIEDLFHIPLNLRGYVKTQRYSYPGYPCLYLAHSVYGCWEELGRPNFKEQMISKVVIQRSFNIFDLRIPSEIEWEKNKNYWVLLFPLIIACMFPVIDENCIFKAEYILPQLLTEWVIIRRQLKKVKGDSEEEIPIFGIIYTSSHRNNDFPFFSSDKLDNLAIPIIDTHKREFCSKLSDIFYLSKPTYYEIEEIIDSASPCVVVYKRGLPPNYESSMFGKMEMFLKKKEVFKVKTK